MNPSTEGRDLQQAFGAPAAQVRKPVSPGDADGATQPARQRHEQRTGRGEYEQKSDQPAEEAGEHRTSRTTQ